MSEQAICYQLPGGVPGGGANHGKGLAVATLNTAAMAESWIERYAGEKGLQQFRSEISPAVYQGSLFDGV